MNKNDSAIFENSDSSPDSELRFIPREIRQKIKTELRYRHGSVAEWTRIHNLNYGYVTQVLSGIAPGHNIRTLLEKEGLLHSASGEVPHV
ncbi:hypothetical protein LEP1GSC034_0895 [Leptospira interrogans str. 2003000735]|uniref:Uncharacterized protein n=2 Tax=Leptospira interrogans TaxID=173 RepID=A0A829D463_LEPIR|nr:hypothetical protein [Leptospira interrogans]EMY03880.1 hypothetical protein LEP1GSC029_3787 [Leptospira interrogans str. 2002000626]EMY26767.1 hypothetical protein LEP1GSC115_4514 [Leptospira interrogans serovar Australis str. 200703203]EKN86906.1 hypothetical protein LEP1GSC027_2481 [Leptospira interrogans str. 2002000624]EKQ37057.1 hypothetical protein LEP1GSC025_1398 [Leptospira interrogans str. 2002000621]EKQ46496.1 hypothetical protein LEP1GSC026_1119 [Leptospira interrogans str. 2002